MSPPGVCLSPQLILLWVSSRKEATIDGAAQIENCSCEPACRFTDLHSAFRPFINTQKGGHFL